MTSITKASSIIIAAVVLFSAATVSAEGKSANLSTGNHIVVVDQVKVRETAGGSQVGSQARGAHGTLVGGPIVMNGYTWWNVDYDNGTDGWSAEDFMQLSTVALTSPNQGAVAGVSTTADSQTQITALQAQLQALMAQLQALIAAISN